VGRSRTLDQEFGETTLRVLRETVLAHATAAGMPEGRALDVMLAVHELAANAVEHGGGTGRLRMSVTNRELICRVSDPGPASSGLPRNSMLGSQCPGAAAQTSPWPYEPGHGLWLVRQIADHISVNCSPAGSQVTVAFTMLRSAMP
jgi:anti-sigma regulatory factor (Ser/Thr protein kinase)